MGVTEWPGGQWITAGVYWINEASDSKLLLIGQATQTAFFNKSNKSWSNLSYSSLEVHSIRIVLHEIIHCDDIIKTVLFVTSQTILQCMRRSLVVVRLVVQQLATYAVGRKTIPCICNCWARPRGLQKIVYFNWGQRAEKFENHWVTQSDAEQMFASKNFFTIKHVEQVSSSRKPVPAQASITFFLSRGLGYWD